MRSDQEIGLTDRAKIFLNTLKENGKIIREEKVDIAEYAFSENKVVGVKIWIEPEYNANKEEYFEETLQTVIWSSGPMYFTCLKHVIVKQMNNQVIELGKCYEWTRDPMVKYFDPKIGAYNL